MDFLQHITLETSGIGSSLTRDYLSGKKELRKFYEFEPDSEGLKKAAEIRMNVAVNRQLLYDELHKQYGSSVLSESLKSNIELLLQPNTFTITTGHQLNLFTGPLYFIYKIVSVISLAATLTEENPGKHFVPVYWMNSEDHDFAEINHFFLKGEKYEWKVEQDKYGPVGRMDLNDMQPFIADIKNKFGEHFHHDPVFDAMIRSYTESGNLAEAHRTIVNKIFGEYGVIILDQDSKALKAEFSKHISKEIFERSSIENVLDSNKELESLHYKPQVFAREINFFYTGKGYRERIIGSEGEYEMADHSLKWSRTELEKELKDHPQFFSPNVVSRPLFQEFILPNIAYVGGPAEIAYWLQYKKNFDSKNIFFPVLILRDCFLILPEKKYRKSKEIGVTLEQYFKDLNELVNEFIRTHYHKEMDTESMIAVLNNEYGKLMKQVTEIDPSMESMVMAGRKKTLKEIERITSKMNKALKRKSELQLNVIKNLHSTIFPLNTLQERLNNLFDQTMSTHTFVNDLLLHANPLDARLKVLLD